jgi:hypothetical protein
MPNLVGDAFRQVSEAARAYERRWTVRALKSVDPELHARFIEQQQLWEQATVTGDKADLIEQTAAMVRGWRAITRRMEQAGAEDDAYLLRVDVRSGLRVAISAQQAALERVQELHGERVVFVTPDECATLLAAQQAVASIKGWFPGAELLDLYPTEPAKAEEA